MGDVITLTTDFGTDDAYVAMMKGVILSINPRVAIVDICHAIQPQNIGQAAFVLSTAHHYFPEGTIHIVVVDPEVGAERRVVLLVTPSAFFIAPDNGVLSYIIEEASLEMEEQPPSIGEGQRQLGYGLQAFALTNPHFWRYPVSDTFHGRDIFAPVAAHLSSGAPAQDFGEPVDTLFTLPLPRPQIKEDGVLAGYVIHIDHFGNLITTFKEKDLPKGSIFIEVAGHIVEGISQSYAEASELLATIGSSGNIEISLKNGNAARLLQAKIGEVVSITKL
jgi:S-adenosylmethionine hydrolase